MTMHERHGARDLTYSAAHRYRLAELYGRTGHRLHTCDRDWTEFCFACKSPLALIEEVRDVGQNLADKAVSLTRRLALRAELPALMVGWWVDRPATVQQRIDTLNAELRRLEALHPITGITARWVTPGVNGLVTLDEPDQWWETIKILHGEHYRRCQAARLQGPPVTEARLHELKADNPLWPEVAGSRIFDFETAVPSRNAVLS